VSSVSEAVAVVSEGENGLTVLEDRQPVKTQVRRLGTCIVNCEL
jgi:hypothetical protein